MFDLSENQCLLALKALEPSVRLRRKQFDHGKRRIRSLSIEWDHNHDVCGRDSDDEEPAFEYDDEDMNAIEVYFVDKQRAREDKIAEYLSELQEAVGRLHYIQSLHMARYPYWRLPWGIGDVATLQSLEIQKCKHLTHLPQSVGRLKNLKLLVIERCESLTGLPSEVGLLCNLKILLLLECCSLKTLPAEIGTLENLEFLQIKNNHCLRSIPPAIGRLPRLERLEIYGLPLVKLLPSELAKLGTLKMLNLISLPRVEAMPEGLCAQFQSLEHVEISCCSPRLSSLNQLSLPALSSLKCVRLSYMDLEEVPLALKRLPSLERMELTGLSPAVLLGFLRGPWNAGMDSLKTLSLRGLCHGHVDRRLGHSYSQILPSIPQSLTRLDLDDQGITALDAFLKNNGRIGLPSTTRRLSLHDNPILKSTNEKDRKCLEQLLAECPRLGWIGYDRYLHPLQPPQRNSPTCHNDNRYRLFTPSLTLLLLLNRCGRALLLDDSNHHCIPLSVWPIILSRVRRKLSSSGDSKDVFCKTKTKSNAMECSVLYSLLQGPAFLSRPSNSECRN